MHFGIMSATGNMLEWFDSPAEAHRARDEMRAEYPDADVVVLAFNDAGDLLGELVRKRKTVVHASQWLEVVGTVEDDAGCILGGLDRVPA